MPALPDFTGVVTIVIWSLTWACSQPVAIAQEPQPVPQLQILPQPYDQASFQRDGIEIARYHFGNGLRRPFVFPLVGPSGRSLTRMGHPRDPVGHSHHNSFWVAHNSVAGVDFWSDRGRNAGRIVQTRLLRYEETGETALMETINDWQTEAQPPKTVMQDYRRLAIRLLGEQEWLLTLDLQLRAQGAAVTLGKTPFGVVAVRMAKTIGVHDGGGTSRNSAGGVNEAGVFWKQARWVDYSGPIAAQAIEGITLMDHPNNPNHPSFFHVRDDGWMGASLTFDADRTIAPESPLTLRYGLYIHAGKPEPIEIERRWQAFAAETPAPIELKR